MPTNVEENGAEASEGAPASEQSRTPSTMHMVVEYRVPAGDLALGRAVAGNTVAAIESLDRERDTVVQYVWVEGGSRHTFEQSAHETTGIEDVGRLDGGNGQWLYRVASDPDRDPLAGALADGDVNVLSGGGDAREWELRLSFPDRATVSRFQTDCTGDGVGLKLDEIYHPVEVQTSLQTDLTDCQRKTLVSAFEEGYYEVPRRTTLVELAGMMKVSDQAVSERLRRAEQKLIRSHLRETT